MTLPELTQAAASHIDPRQLWLAGAAIAALVVGWIVTVSLHRLGRTSPGLHHELVLRLRTWTLIIPATTLPILLGPVGIAAALLALGFVCFREFARAVGIHLDRFLLTSVLTGLVMVAIAIARHDSQLLLLSAPVVGLLTAGTSVFKDQPHGYLKRVGLTNLGFMLCGLWPGHLGFLGSSSSNATLLLWFILSIELNDVFAFLSGKLIGGPRLCPRTSPGKTRGGLVGAMILTTTFVTLSGMFLFDGQALGRVLLLIPLGALTSLSGALGDLILSSIKRDLRLKDLSQSLPGHGGMLDRCDSLLFAAPVIALTLGLIDAFPPTP
ncbi:phosphatidate cytidylyltransferase [Haloferula rosea]|uniref:Phosphatidate cytidylyltransferase n=1 Tax=Haloferula rosea TaxID=490093 RepID=A0A934VD12_9BACT|nr:phosphatidate cytidylyltransferase [Haloferula rosea]MBK1829023.1 phosphatidate cytidylyltransferase [Haloferula rosea]